MTIDFDTLYWIRPSLSDAIFTADFKVDLDSLDAIVRGDAPAIEPLRAFWTEGDAEPGALIRCAGLSSLVVSEALLKLLTGLTGFSSVPISLEDQDGQQVGNYSLLVIHGRCGPIDPTKSQLLTGDSADEPILRGLYFADNDWDQTDLFMTYEQTLFVLGTESVLRKFVDLAQDDVEFTPLSQMEQHPMGMVSIVDHQKRQGINKHDWRWGG